ncbi:response regulator aspartate phosphatase [Bacillus sp. JCM 19047]|nr:response regulator aspartate phosphatase [Bacillus sp. JCM 19047]
MVDESINELNEAGLLFEVCEFAEELNENVIKYFKIAYEAKVNPETIGDGQE